MANHPPGGIGIGSKRISGVIDPFTGPREGPMGHPVPLPLGFDPFWFVSGGFLQARTSGVCRIPSGSAWVQDNEKFI